MLVNYNFLLFLNQLRKITDIKHHHNLHLSLLSLVFGQQLVNPSISMYQDLFVFWFFDSWWAWVSVRRDFFIILFFSPPPFFLNFVHCRWNLTYIECRVLKPYETCKCCHVSGVEFSWFFQIQIASFSFSKITEADKSQTPSTVHTMTWHKEGQSIKKRIHRRSISLSNATNNVMVNLLVKNFRFWGCGYCPNL